MKYAAMLCVLFAELLAIASAGVKPSTPPRFIPIYRGSKSDTDKLPSTILAI